MSDKTGREHIAIRTLRERSARLDEVRRMKIREFEETIKLAKEQRLAAQSCARSIAEIEAAITLLQGKAQ